HLTPLQELVHGPSNQPAQPSLPKHLVVARTERGPCRGSRPGLRVTYRSLHLCVRWSPPREYGLPHNPNNKHHKKKARETFAPLLGAHQRGARAGPDDEAHNRVFVESNDLSIDDRVFWKLVKSLVHKRILPAEGLVASGKEIQLAFRFDGDGAISIQLDFINPLWTVREFRYGKTFHRFYECGRARWKRVKLPVLSHLFPRRA